MANFEKEKIEYLQINVTDFDDINIKELPKFDEEILNYDSDNEKNTSYWSDNIATYSTDLLLETDEEIVGISSSKREKLSNTIIQVNEPDIQVEASTTVRESFSNYFDITDQSSTPLHNIYDPQHASLSESQYDNISSSLKSVQEDLTIDTHKEGTSKVQRKFHQLQEEPSKEIDTGNTAQFKLRSDQNFCNPNKNAATTNITMAEHNYAASNNLKESTITDFVLQYVDIEEVHNRSSFKCSICDHSVWTVAGIKKHMARNHSIGPYKCDSCNLVFEVLHKLEDHNLIVHEICYFECCQCSTQFDGWNRLTKHKKRYHKKSNCLENCSKCKKNLKLQRKLSDAKLEKNKNESPK